MVEWRNSMHELKCPNCGKVFKIDEASYDKVVKQVRNVEFEKELQRTIMQSDKEKEAAIKITEARLEKKMDASLHEKSLEITELKNKIKTMESTMKSDFEVRLAKKIGDKDKEISELKNQLKLNLKENELSVKEAVSSKDKVIERLQNEIKNSNSEFLLKEKSIKEGYDEKIRLKDEQIAYYRDFKARQSTKMVGESLEQHCFTEFNRYRPLFKNAYFEKDNDVKTGSKGDFIFRDYDDDGTEITSIMFEMKNEADMTATKHKNEDFLKELDKDRQEKKCEYAVLVSLLEIDNEYYNTGIVDVSYRYSKMYIIRPQFFIPLITLIRSMGLNTLSYKKQLELLHEENIDITNFEENLEKFKDDFGRNYNLASKKFKTAIEEIDKTIDHLQKTKDALLSSDKNLRIANEKIDSITIKKLTHNNKSVQNMFANLKKDKNQVANILGDEIKLNSKNDNGKNDTVN